MSIHNLYSIFPIEGVFYRFDSARAAFAYYLNKRVNLITGLEESYPIHLFNQSLEREVIAKESLNPKVTHLFYEYSFVVEKLENELEGDELLAIEIEYEKAQELNWNENSKKIQFDLVEEIDFRSYQEKFQAGFQELLKGNCYQFNLTSPSFYRFDQSCSEKDFYEILWKKKENVAAFAHFTFIGLWNKAYLSNSPECLFELNANTLVTRPIKGTLKRESDDPEEIKVLWEKLQSDSKNQAELFMITDLLRNDLSRINIPNAKVVAAKKMLLVPNLIHQYSEISIDLLRDTTLKQILFALFPGGSITGAPKKNSIRIIKKLEKNQREFYCGSTILHFQENLKASINIRSAEINLSSYILKYSSGGGITLKSEIKDEFSELIHKKVSFFSLFS